MTVSPSQPSGSRATAAGRPGVGVVLVAFCPLLAVAYLLVDPAGSADAHRPQIVEATPELGGALRDAPALPPDDLPATDSLHNEVPSKPAEAETPEKKNGGQTKFADWASLFDGKDLNGWKSTEFGGEGDVLIEGGSIVMTMGNDMTGVTTTRKDLPTIDYEISFQGRRVQGNDFFCGLTFPIAKEPCSLILGGWGGGVCGLSSIDGFDASENSTSTFRDFENGKWYTVRLRVTKPLIVVWIDGEKLLEQDLEGRRISIRAEVELSRPLGFSTWRTTGAVRDVKMRKLSAKEVAETKPES